jgi:molecular chaperone GrpE (heat shock protein)
MSILTSNGLEPIRAAGETLDHVHEAVRRVETVGVPEGTVLEELRRGYRLNGTLVRLPRSP